MIPGGGGGVGEGIKGMERMVHSLQKVTAGIEASLMKQFNFWIIGIYFQICRMQWLSYWNIKKRIQELYQLDF